MDVNRLLSPLNARDEAEKKSFVERFAGTDVAGIAYDSRKVAPGFIFVAIKGALTDGHLYLKQAQENGALFALVETPDTKISLPQLAVQSSRRALSHLSSTWYSHPSREMLMTGITGSNGKTTTAMMLDHILIENGITPGMIGTIFYRLGERLEASDLTTPESLELHGFLREQVDYGYTHSVMEVSSISIEQCREADITYDVMAFNNITREHIDQHGTFEKYLAAKMSLMKRLPASSIAVIGLDDPIIEKQCRALSARTISFGLENKHADILAENLDLSSGFGAFDLTIKRQIPTLKGSIAAMSVPVRLAVPGLSSVFNALSAVTMAIAQGLAVEDAASGISTYKGIERRFQQVYNGAYQIYDDHYANAGNVRMTLSATEYMDKKRLHLAFAVRGNRGVTVNREVAEEMALWKDKLPWGTIIVTLSRDITTPKDHVSEEEADIFIKTLREVGYEFSVVETLKEAMEQIVDVAEAGDVVILGGAQGMDPGARFALHHILSKDPELDEDAILAPLEGRICG